MWARGTETELAAVDGVLFQRGQQEALAGVTRPHIFRARVCRADAVPTSTPGPCRQAADVRTAALACAANWLQQQESCFCAVVRALHASAALLEALATVRLRILDGGRRPLSRAPETAAPTTHGAAISRRRPQ